MIFILKLFCFQVVKKKYHYISIIVSKKRNVIEFKYTYPTKSFSLESMIELIVIVLV